MAGEGGRRRWQERSCTVSPRNQAEDVGESESFARACVLAYLDRGVQDFNPSNVLVERRGERQVRELPNRRLVNKCIKMRGKVEIRVVLVTNGES